MNGSNGDLALLAALVAYPTTLADEFGWSVPLVATDDEPGDRDDEPGVAVPA